MRCCAKACLSRPPTRAWLAEKARDATDIPARFLGLQLTGGSTAIPDAYHKMRLAGAAARTALVLAASRRLGQPVSDLTAKHGAIQSLNGDRLSYVELAARRPRPICPNPLR